MVKKDSVTKIKALQEFIEHVENENIDLNPALQFWSRCYCRLSMSGDNRVRELSHQALSKVIARAKKDYASCLKTVLPYCILSQADGIATVAVAAKTCFESSFPEDKREQAIDFCRFQTYDLISSVFDNSNPYLNDK